MRTVVRTVEVISSKVVVATVLQIFTMKALRFDGQILTKGRPCEGTVMIHIIRDHRGISSYNLIKETNVKVFFIDPSSAVYQAKFRPARFDRPNSNHS